MNDMKMIKELIFNVLCFSSGQILTQDKVRDLSESIYEEIKPLIKNNVKEYLNEPK